MIGKVLLLALACVAANEVVGDNLNGKIESGIKEVRYVRGRTTSILNAGLDVYYESDEAILDTVRSYIQLLQVLQELDVDAVITAAQRLVEVANNSQAEEEVFTCISDRKEKAVQDINNAVSNFEKTFNQVGEVKREAQFKIGFGMFKIRATLFFKDNLLETVEDIKFCQTEDCVFEIVNTFTEQYRQINAQITSVRLQLNPYLEQFKDDIKQAFFSGRRDINKVKEIGIESMKSCLNKEE